MSIVAPLWNGCFSSPVFRGIIGGMRAVSFVFSLLSLAGGCTSLTEEIRTGPDAGDSDTGSGTLVDTGSGPPTECPTGSGYPCSCEADSGLCDDGSDCIVDFGHDGICASACDDGQEDHCVETGGWGVTGICAWSIGDAGVGSTHCGVICDFADEVGPCPPGQECWDTGQDAGLCVPQDFSASDSE